jgi:hypothetical protein
MESSKKKYVDGGDLNKGESVCVDRCAKKFVESFEKISTMMNARSQQAMAQQQQQA